MTDIALNLTDLMFQGIYNNNKHHESDILDILKRAWLTGCKRIIITGGSLLDSKEAIKMAHTFNNERDINNLNIPQCYATVGCHPTKCNEFEGISIDLPEKEASALNYFQELKQLIETYHINQPNGVVVAVGECGLDYDRTQFCSIDIQKKYFLEQIKLAEMFSLPLFLHNRSTKGDFVDIIRHNRHRFPHGVVHSFTDSMEEMKALVDCNLYIGINGCSLKTEEKQLVASSIPLNYLMIETDAPWCSLSASSSSFLQLDQFMSSILNDKLSIETNKDVPVYDSLYYYHSLQSVKYKKFKPGHMIKSRNEPANLILILTSLSLLHNQYNIKKNIGIVDYLYKLQDLASTIENNVNKLFF